MLQKLPKDMLLCITQFCPLPDSVNIFLSSKYLYQQIENDNEFWKQQCCKFGVTQLWSDSAKKCYQEAIKVFENFCVPKSVNTLFNWKHAFEQYEKMLQVPERERNSYYDEPRLLIRVITLGW